MKPLFAPSQVPEAADSLKVFEEEFKTIVRQRHNRAMRRRAAPAGPEPPDESPMRLSGLALSGGGIRSATFNLGVLQALAREKLLGFDYLSTVSGGGYVGGWWSAWLRRHPESTFPPDEGSETLRHAASKPVRPDPVHHVRLFSNYLTPRKGVMSRDMWRAITVVTRNLFLTWTVLVPMLAVPILLSQAALLWAQMATGADTPQLVAALPLSFAACMAALTVAWLLAQHGGAQHGQRVVTVGGIAALAWMWTRFDTGPGSAPGDVMRAALTIASAVVFAGLAKAGVLRPAFWRSADRQTVVNLLSRMQGICLVGGVLTAALGLVAAFGDDAAAFLVRRRPIGFATPVETIIEAGKYALGAVTLASAILAGRKGSPAGGGGTVSVQIPATQRLLIRMAPALTMAALVLAIAAAGAYAQRLPADPYLGLLRGAALIGVIVMALYAVGETRARVPALLAAGLIVVQATVTLLQGAGITGNGIGAEWVVWLAVPVFVGSAARVAAMGRLVGRAEWLLLSASVISSVSAFLAADPRAAAYAQPHVLLALTASLATIVLLLGWTSDPNTLSLHMFYKMRLVRAYVGASSRNRTGGATEDVTESKPDDDVLLKEISDPDGVGPYHLINATLNLTAGSDLVIAQRAAAPFLFSRLYCGSSFCGFRPTKAYRAGTLTLGTAVAVSGAAASPVMGSHTPSTARSMLLALLNVRLGYWLPTPRGADWEAPQARLWPFYLLREFVSHTAAAGRYCYVTDGGHFDNTGVYSLVERGCTQIVLTDCGADPRGAFDDLATLARRCRIDFGAQIRFPGIERLTPAAGESLRRHVVTAYIRFAGAHLKSLGWQPAAIAQTAALCPPEVLEKLGWQGLAEEGDGLGTLIVIKPNLAGEQEIDVHRYSREHADFPQQTTADQWFDEAQFESYRQIGERSGRAAASRIRTRMPDVVA